MGQLLSTLLSSEIEGLAYNMKMFQLQIMVEIKILNNLVYKATMSNRCRAQKQKGNPE